MAGNSARRGAVRKPGSKKGARVGTGGHSRRGLEGRGPTPKAEERTGHPAARRKAAAERAQAADPARGARNAGDKELIIGRNPVIEALAADVPATTLYVAQLSGSHDAKVREILAMAQARDLGVIEISKPDLDRMVGTRSHQGVALLVPPYQYAHVDELLRDGSDTKPLLLLALDSVTDPHNLGAALRSAAAFGAHGVIVPQRRSASVGATVWKVSAGAAARVRVAQTSNLVQALRQCKEAGCFVVGLAGDGATDIADLTVADGPLVLVLGSEGAGLGRLVRETCDVVASIPIRAATESLNASVAMGIALYQVAQLRR